MLCMSIFDCLLDFEPFVAFVGVVCAVEVFADGEKLILVWRFGALDRLRAIVVRAREVKVVCYAAPLRSRRVGSTQSYLGVIHR